MPIGANVEARTKFTYALHGFKSPVVPRLTAAEAEAALFGIAYKEPGMATKADCIEIFERVFAERGKMEADAVLSRHGVWKITDLSLILYNRFFAYCQAILTYGASPFYGWEVNSITDKVRDRWLLWHSESDSLWEVRGKLSNELDSGDVRDVTGIIEYEHRFLAEHRRFSDPLPDKDEEL